MPAQIVADRAALGLPDPPGWLEPWYRFDAGYYAGIAFKGYTHTPGQKSSIAFMPLLPALMAAGNAVGIDPYVAGWAVANSAFVLGLACFGRVCLRLTGNPRTAWWACAFLVAYPYSLFCSAPYQESLYLALSVAVVYFWLHDRPILAVPFAVLAGTARLTAGGLTAGFGLEWLRGVTNRSGRPSYLLVAAAPLVGVALFCGYLYAQFGDPLLHFKGHQAWGRSPPSLGGFVRVFGYVFDSPDLKRTLFQGAIAFGILALGVRGWVRRGPVWGCLILTPILQAAATGTLGSIERIALSAYPAALEAAELPLGRVGRWGFVLAGIAGQVWMLRWYMRGTYIA